VPLLPYASGCFLASVLLTISGIAETHPQALALATYLIQFGWLLLQIQGVMLVYTFGSHGQGLTLFKVWVVLMQLMDFHRRFLSSYLSALSLSSFLSTLTGRRGDATATSFSPTHHQNNKQSHHQHPKGGQALAVVSGGGGMKEMENLVLFEVVAGLGVSGLMCLLWAAMAIRRGGVVAIPGVRRTRARVQRWAKTIKGLRDEWREAVVAKVDTVVEQAKLRVGS